ncbi:ferritin-like domain-containing protein [Cyclobacterium sediminis]
MMNIEDNKLIHQIGEILEKNKDAEKGYNTAAENAEDPELKEIFLKRSNERRDFNLRLKREVDSNYGELSNNGTYKGAIERTWMDAKSFVAGKNDLFLLENIIRGESAALDEYEELLKAEHLPIMLSQIIQNHLIKIRTDIIQIKSIKQKMGN